MSNELAIPETYGMPTERHSSGFEMKPRNLDEAMKFCDIMAKSELVPKDYRDKPGNIMVAIQLGTELGLTPMRAMRCIAVINGRASMWGDEMMAMVLASPVCEYVRENESTDKVGICKVKRKDDAEEHVSTFTLEDAKRAGLLGKQGPWQTNTARMLKLRARGFALRDKFPDVLAGLVTAEEAMDTPAETPLPVTAQIEQPPSLKERLKAKVESVQEPEPIESTAPAPLPAAPVPVSEKGPERSSGDHPAGQSTTQDTSGTYSTYRMKIGRQKGQPVTDLDDENLQWALNYYLDKIRDQPTSRYQAEWTEAVSALEEEKTMREGVMGEQA